MSAIENSEFVSGRAKVDYILFVIATFFVFLSCSSIVCFAPVFLESGFSPLQIGTILSAGAFPVVVCAVVAGTWIGKLGLLNVIRLGVALAVVSFLCLQRGADTQRISIAAIGVGVMSAGAGFFMPAAFIYVHSLVSRKRLMRYVGIYSAMFQLPLLVSPQLTEYALVHWGRQYFFLLTAIPSVIGLLLLSFVKLNRNGNSGVVPLKDTASYIQVLRDGLPWAPYVAGVTAALLLGTVNAFASLELIRLKLPISFFFGFFAFGFVIMRFAVMPFLDGFGKRVLACGALVLMLVGIFVASRGSVLTVMTGGCLLGFGYSIAYPTCTVWISETFTGVQQTRPLAIFNGVFSFSVHGAPLLAATVVHEFGTNGLVAALLFGGGASTACLCVPWTKFKSRLTGKSRLDA